MRLLVNLEIVLYIEQNNGFKVFYINGSQRYVNRESWEAEIMRDKSYSDVKWGFGKWKELARTWN